MCLVCVSQVAIKETQKASPAPFLSSPRCAFAANEPGAGGVEAGVSRSVLVVVEVSPKVLGDEPVEQDGQEACHEVRAVNPAARVVRDAPDRLVQFCPLGLFGPVHPEVAVAGRAGRRRFDRAKGLWWRQ